MNVKHASFPTLAAAICTASALAGGLVTEDLSGPLTPADLVAEIVGPGVMVSNVTFVGADGAAGTFSGGTGIIGFEGGIMLSSGSIANAVGPNVSDGITTSWSLPGDADLDGRIPGFTTNDACVLEFDFECEQLQIISFQYVFTSDEYNEFVDSSFNDVFAFYVNGVNAALLPNGDPVSINNVNCGNPYSPPFGGSFCDLFINNDLDDGGGAVNTEMDGLTVVLNVEVAVNPGVNHIKLAIADAGDFVLDSNVFIESGSFVCEPVEQPCMNISNDKVFCLPEKEGCYTWSADITNKSGVAVKYVLLPTEAVSPEDCTVQPNVINLLLQDGSLLEDGETTHIEVLICCDEGKPGEEVCFDVTLADPDFVVCCNDLVCIELPECDCGQLLEQEFSDAVCTPDGLHVAFTFDFILENLSGFAAEDVFFIPFNDEQGFFLKDYFELPPLLPGESIPLQLQVVNAKPGEEFCFLVVLLLPGDDCCCAFEKCITVPDCPGLDLGACCLELPPFGCVLTPDVAGCAAMGGIWHGPGSTCDECPFQTGACCFIATGICNPVASAAECIDPDGGAIFLGPGSTCEECPFQTGACCITALGLCFPVAGPADCVTPAGPGVFLGPGSTCDQCPVPAEKCTGDLNSDGQVSGIDLAMLLGEWTGISTYRPCPPNNTADLNDDCKIDGLDLAMLLGAWGGCP